MYLCSYVILTIVLPALLLHDLLSKGFFLPQTTSDKKANFFVIPPEIQPRRDATLEKDSGKKEAKSTLRVPGLLISMEENVSVYNEIAPSISRGRAHKIKTVHSNIIEAKLDLPAVDC